MPPRKKEIPRPRKKEATSKKKTVRRENRDDQQPSYMLDDGSVVRVDAVNTKDSNNYAKIISNTMVTALNKIEEKHGLRETVKILKTMINGFGKSVTKWLNEHRLELSRQQQRAVIEQWRDLRDDMVIAP
jgi:hypothetical protein